jgi:hypothetical protein
MVCVWFPGFITAVCQVEACKRTEHSIGKYKCIRHNMTLQDLKYTIQVYICACLCVWLALNSAAEWMPRLQMSARVADVSHKGRTQSLTSPSP